MRLEYNYRARNVKTNRVCGHMHHSEKKAKACAEHLGWDPDSVLIEKIYQQQFEGKRNPSRAFNDVLNECTINEYFVNICLTVRADSEVQAQEHVDKWFKSISNAKGYTGHTVESIRSVET